MKTNLNDLKKVIKTLGIKIEKETDKVIVIFAGKGVYLKRIPIKNGVRKRVICVSTKPKPEEVIDPELFGCVAESGIGLKILIRSLSNISSGDSQKSPSFWKVKYG
ncbi:MAG: hypothetical protein V1732_04275 [Patescibacteria group bacterium]